MNETIIPKYWYYYLFPAFICSAGTQWIFGRPTISTVIGFLSASVVAHIAFMSISKMWRVAFTVFLPMLILAILIILTGATTPEVLRTTSDIINPRFMSSELAFWRMMMAGLGGIVTVFGGILIAKLPFSYNKFAVIGATVVGILRICVVRDGYIERATRLGGSLKGLGFEYLLASAVPGMILGAILGVVVGMVIIAKRSKSQAHQS